MFSDRHILENRGFFVALCAISAVFVWALLPFLGAILWGLVAAILFAPLNARLLRAWPERRNTAALLSVLAIAALVILPTFWLLSIVIDQAGSLFARIQSGQIDVARSFEQAHALLPEWIRGLLERSGVTSFGELRDKISAGLATQFRAVLGQAFSIGQDAASFALSLSVMLYLTFFLLRDGKDFAARISKAVPLAADDRDAIADRFVKVVRATVKGGLLVAIAQGAVGGMIMAALGVPNVLLWAIVMAIAALLPAIGTGLVWVPMAIYLLSTGSIWQGIVLALAGLLVIGSVDNILRPILIGRETAIPDALVLLTTLGGVASFGFNGLVIGPVAAALFLTMWDRYSVKRRETPPA
ncbi:AI-2E family transporter [Sphingomonas sp. RB3P16]|uniref:AI-2E family transporter n=1 Tax=Parasphingomonas frigoris TaxID=3096163 RepID=UPI002FC7D51B